MTNKTRRSTRSRRCAGSAISEFGPALLILLCFFFLPLVDILSIAVSYALCTVLNTNQVHEASLEDQQSATDPGGVVRKTIPEQWLGGMGKFVKTTGLPETNITYSAGSTEKDSDATTDQIVTVSTTVLCEPFLPIPLPLLSVPGLNKPMTFQIVSQRQMENPDNAK